MSDVLRRLDEVLAQRRRGDPGSSYVASLHAAGLGKILAKVEEECAEVVEAAGEVETGGAGGSAGTGGANGGGVAGAEGAAGDAANIHGAKDGNTGGSAGTSGTDGGGVAGGAEGAAGDASSRQALVSETADLWFHCLVLLSHLGSDSSQVLAELERRFGRSGLDEKASRVKD